ncbi:MAG TPA: TIGR02757 family protein [bacterium]|jgi:uncharacterized protein (TIGR02757 family)
MVRVTREALEEIYNALNRREFVHPDPVEFLYHYDDPVDREIVGMIASSLAFGKVSHILASVSNILARTGSPSGFLERSGPAKIKRSMDGFKHRWATGNDMAAMLTGLKKVIRKYGSLENCLMSHLGPDDETVQDALNGYVGEIVAQSGAGYSSLLSEPSRGSACKRLHLFLKWMVRHDDVDPGGWDNVPKEKLIIPVDTHMYRICRGLEFTERKSANLLTALEITREFRKINPDDPARYDFALTRLGIRNELDPKEFIDQCLRETASAA